jgi:hypothetical protein
VPVNEKVVQRWERNLKALNDARSAPNVSQALKRQIESSGRIAELEKFIRARGAVLQVVQETRL